MTTFADIQGAFRSECDRSGRVPNLANYDIRRVLAQNVPVYVVIYEYIHHSGSDKYAEILPETDINWPGKPNEKTFRNSYFHQSKQDTNIWILKQEYRGASAVLRALLKEKTKMT